MGYRGDYVGTTLSMRQQDPITVVEYVYEHGLQDKLGWRWAKKYRRGINKYVNAVLRANKLSRDVLHTSLVYAYLTT